MRSKLLVTGLALLCSCATGRAAIIVEETWETPSISAGSTSATLPASWTRFSGSVNDSQVWHPDSVTNFNQVQSLESPAGGSQLLLLRDTNTGVYRMSGANIAANTTYELSAAIGNELQTSNTQFWSLQLWADTNSSGFFEGSGGDTFIGQQFGTSGTALNASAGEWVSNSFSFNSATTTSLIGQEMIVFLNNFNDGTSYYDNVRLSQVPEPTTLAIWSLLGGIGLVAGHRRRRHRRAR